MRVLGGGPGAASQPQVAGGRPHTEDGKGQALHPTHRDTGMLSEAL